ncbi:hypothetical protein [Treponema sp.]|uniref:hypothetical protein n=1 Tax=Treponema sp. TaxID=166 RepID=UPI00298EA838|nr:hypothetical protein [Treponema sp.]MCR5613512.1 hypothetical protein [Treponema sp.]
MFEFKLSKKGLFFQDFGFSVGLRFLIVAIIFFVAAAADGFFDNTLPILGGVFGGIGLVICIARYVYLNAVCRDAKCIDGKVKNISYSFLLRARTAVYEYTFEGKDYTKTCYFTRYSSVRDRNEGDEIKLVINPAIPDRALPEYMYF